MATEDTIVVKHEADDFDDDVSGSEDEDAHAAFQARDQLQDSRVARHTIQHLMNLINGPYMDLDPDYQREVVWTADRMTKLINSLMENYYVPPVIFNCERLQANDSAERWRRVCVDGKQRISSIQAFIKGQIPCQDKRNAKWYFSAPTNSRHQILPQDVKDSFLRKEILCVEFAGLSRQQEEDLFARVQLGVTLTPAEKMRATTGPWQDFAKMFEDDFRPIMKLLKGQARSAGFRMYLQCFSQILEVQHPTNANGIPVIKTSVTAVEKLLDNHRALGDSTKSHLATVFTTFNELILERDSVFKDNGYERVKTFSPLELVAVSVLISKYGDRRNHEMLLGDISLMRITLRGKRVDLRLNGDCWNLVWEFIDTLEQFRGATDGDLESQTQKQSAPANAVQQPELTPGPSTSAKPARKSAKKTSDKPSSRKSAKTPSKSSETPAKMVHWQASVTENTPPAQDSTGAVATTSQPSETLTKTPIRWKEPMTTKHPHAQRSAKATSTPGQSAFDPRAFEPVQIAIEREIEPSRENSPPIFVRSTSPDSVIEVNSDTDEEMPDRPSIATTTKSTPPFGFAGSLQFTPAKLPSAAPARQVAPVAPMAPMVPTSPMVSRPKATMTPAASRPASSVPMPPRPRSNVLIPPRPGEYALMPPRPKPKAVPSHSPMPDENQIQAELSQTYADDSPEEGEILEEKRQNLLAQFRTTRTPETGASRSDDSEDDRPIDRKRRAEGSLGTACPKAFAHKRMKPRPYR